MKMNDAELSLAVARIMWPEYKWKMVDPTSPTDYIIGVKEGEPVRRWRYTDDDTGMKMCIWLRNAYERLIDECAPGGSAMIHHLNHAPTMGLRIYNALGSKDPHREIAEAIREIGGSDE